METPDSKLIAGEKFFVLAQLKLHTPFFDFGPTFRGDTQPIEKDLLDFRCKILCWIFSKNKYLKIIVIPEAF